jgi:hypothetical protein
MRRSHASLTVAAVAAVALTGCALLQQTPEQRFVTEARALLDGAGAVYPGVGLGSTPDEVVLNLGESLCEARTEQAENGGMMTREMFASSLALVVQVEASTAEQVVSLAAEHLCPEHAE